MDRPQRPEPVLYVHSTCAYPVRLFVPEAGKRDQSQEAVASRTPALGQSNQLNITWSALTSRRTQQFFQAQHVESLSTSHLRQV